ncbi:unnamed protein product [Rhizopus microsporus]
MIQSLHDPFSFSQSFQSPTFVDGEKIKSPCRKTATTSISITVDFVCPTAPEYEESVQTIIFTTADKFEE